MTTDLVAPGFERVAEEFHATAPSDGSQLSVRVDGATVLDLAAGIAHDAVMTVYSCSKGAAALVMATLVDRELLDLDARVVDYWPEFAPFGKDRVLVRELLSHQAGLATIDGGIPAAAWSEEGRVAALLAAARPVWRPGAAFGYHGLTIGALAGELCRRITGITLQAFYEREIRVPRGIDFYLGLPAESESRVVGLLPMAEPTAAEVEALRQRGASGPGAFGPAVFGGEEAPITSAEGRALGLPAAGGVGSARGMSALYAATLGADALVSDRTMAEFAQVQVAGYDVVLDQHRSHGIIFQKPTPNLLLGSYRAYGHDGAGGALAYADPTGAISFGYTVPRVPFPGGADARALRLGALVREVVLA